jgi:hypothetical protein
MPLRRLSLRHTVHPHGSSSRQSRIVADAGSRHEGWRDRVASLAASKRQTNDSNKLSRSSSSIASPSSHASIVSNVVPKGAAAGPRPDRLRNETEAGYCLGAELAGTVAMGRYTVGRNRNNVHEPVVSVQHRTRRHSPACPRYSTGADVGRYTLVHRPPSAGVRIKRACPLISTA